MTRTHANPSIAPDRTPGRSAARGGGFSLIELLGTLSVVTILALALVPVLIREYDRHARDLENRQMTQLSKGLERHILRTRSIPGQDGFAQALASELGWQISDVLLNARRQPRVLLIDPAITNTFPLPYTQTWNGVASSVPLALGVVLISSVSVPLPAGLVSGFASTTQAFSNIWNAAENAVPAGWSWNGRGEDLRIARINLGTLFIPLALNYEPYLTGATNRGRFTIDNSTTNTLPTLPSFVGQYLMGTVVGLHHHAGTTGTLQARIVLQNPSSFFYQGAAWRGQSFLGRGMRPTSAMDLQAAHDLFIASPPNTEAQGSPQATPTLVVGKLTAYLQQYVAWRNAGYPNSHKALDNAHDDLDSATSDLLHHASKSAP